MRDSGPETAAIVATTLSAAPVTIGVKTKAVVSWGALRANLMTGVAGAAPDLIMVAVDEALAPGRGDVVEMVYVA